MKRTGKRSKYLVSLGAVIYPVSCCLCNDFSHNNAVCECCWSKVMIIDEPFCIKCSKPFLNILLLEYADVLLCEDCQSNPIYFKKCRSLAVYQDVFIDIILRLKFFNKPHIAHYLGIKLAGMLAEDADFAGIDYVMAVPLQRSRERVRGYNQSLLIAKEISGDFGIPLLKHSLERKHEAKPQSNLSMRERRKNVRGNFYVKNPAKLKGTRILLIDDVFTTGSTVNECSRILRHAGVREVLVATLARTLW